MISESEYKTIKRLKSGYEDKCQAELTQILTISNYKRSKQDATKLQEILLRYNSFQVVAQYNMKLFRQLASEVYMEGVLPNSTVFKYGEPAENCYVIVSGKCRAFI